MPDHQWRTAIRALAAIFCVCLFQAGCGDKPNTPKTEPKGGDYYPAWSPDGKTIAYLSEDIDDSTGWPDDWLRKIDLATKTVTDIWDIPEGLGIWDLSWSPDSRCLVFSSVAGIFKILPNGDSLQQLTQGQFQNSPTWSETTNQIYFAMRGVYSVDPDGLNFAERIPPDSAIAEVRCIRGSDSLLVARDRQVGMVLMVANPVSGWLGDSVLYCENGIYELRIGIHGDMIVFLGQPLFRTPLTVYRVSRRGGSPKSVWSGEVQAFDLAPDDSNVVIADVRPPKSLMLVNMYTKAKARLTRLNGTTD